MKNEFKTAISLALTAVFVLVSYNAIYAQTTNTGNNHQQSWTEQSVKEHVNIWKESPKKAANEMINKYGVPNEVTNQRLVWNNNGQWAQTIIVNEEINHDFPIPHKDCMEQITNYQVPLEKYSDLAKFDGSVIVERTKGTLAARCDKEPMNFLAVNLAHDVAQEKKSIEEARDFYAETAVAFMKGDKGSKYTQGLIYQTNNSAGDSDKTTVDKSVIKELKKGMK